MPFTKTILLALHLILVNLAAIGPLFCIGLVCQTSSEAWRSARWLTGKCCLALFIGMLLGGTIIGLYSFGGEALGGKRFFRALLAIPHDRLWWGVAELFFYYLCMLPVLFYWRLLLNRRWVIILLCLLAGTNLIYHFTPLFVVVGYLQGTAEVEPLTKAALRSLTFSPAVLARVLHHLLAGVAIVATLLMLHSATCVHDARSDVEKAGRNTLTRRFASVLFIVTLLEIPSGIWFLLQLPRAVQHQFLGGSLLVTVWFAVALLAAMLLLYKSFAVTTGATSRRDVWQPVGLLLTVILLMTGLLAFILPRYA